MKGSSKALFLSTISFAIAFAVWGMISPLAKTFQTMFSLTEQQTWAIIAIPVLLGSIIRIPMGMLTDKFGGRIVFGLLLLFIALPAYKLSFADSYNDFVIWGLALGMAGTSFSVGVGFALAAKMQKRKYRKLFLHLIRILKERVRLCIYRKY